MDDFRKLFEMTALSAATERQQREGQLRSLQDAATAAGLQVVCNVPYDGDCFFNSILKLVPQVSDCATSLRNKLVDYFKSSECDQQLRGMVDEAFLAEIGTPYRDVQENLVVSGMADMLQRPVKVFSYDPDTKSVEENTFQPSQKCSAELVLGHIKDKHFVPCKYTSTQRKRRTQSLMDMFVKRPKQGTENPTLGTPTAISPSSAHENRVPSVNAMGDMPLPTPASGPTVSDTPVSGPTASDISASAPAASDTPVSGPTASDISASAPAASGTPVSAPTATSASDTSGTSRRGVSTAKVRNKPLVSVGEEPNQPKLKTFPWRTFGIKSPETRRFNIEWFTLWPWLHYSESEDKVYCHTCVQALGKNVIAAKYKVEPSFTTDGFHNWKDATRKFAQHEKSDCHKEAVSRLIELPAATRPVSESLSEDYNMETSASRRNLLKILQNIQFLARQGLPLRGHGSGENSNFIQLLHLREIDNPDLGAWLKKKTDKYVSASVQNEVLQIMANHVLEQISQSVKEADFFSVLADETADASNKEQLVVCVRWVDSNFNAHEEFLGIKETEQTTAAEIVKQIKAVLSATDLSVSRMRGQCYDGCSTMSGSKSGVAVTLKEVEPRALYTHCYCHAVNLACSDSIKNVKVIKSSHDTAHEISKLVKNSPKRDTHFQKMKSALGADSRPGILRLCPVRWTVRGKALDSIIQNYTILQDLWEWSLENCTESDMRARIMGVSSHMEQFDFYFGLCLGETLLRHSDNLSEALQRSEMSAAQAQEIARMTRQTLQSIRSDSAFALFWAKTCRNADAAGVSKPSLPRQRRPPARLTGDAPAVHPSSAEEHYRRMYFEGVDTLISCLKGRFEQPDFAMYATCEQVLLKAAKRETYDAALEEVVKFYGSDFNRTSLRTQLETFAADFPTGDSRDPHLSDVIKYMKTLDNPKILLISQVALLVKLVLVMPATDAVSERSFSALKRVKSHLRTTTKEERLNSLLLLHVHKDRTDNLELIVVANQFAAQPHRSDVFGRKFTPVDLSRQAVVLKNKSTQTVASKCQ